MSPRVVVGLALWLGLGALPVAHLGWTAPSMLALMLPLPLLFFAPRAGVLFPLALLPLFVVRPDLASARSHGAASLISGAALLLTYLVVALREPLPRRPRPPAPAGHFASLLAVAAAVLCACALCVPWLPEVADALRAGYAANPGAAATLLAAGCLALLTGLVLVYLAAPLDALAKRRS